MESLFLDFDDYQDEASATAIYSDDYRMSYPLLGLVSEVGELCGKVKKVLRDKSGLFTCADHEAIGAEMGDVLWYLAALATDLDLSLATIAENNIAKLKSRQERNVLQGSGDNR